MKKWAAMAFWQNRKSGWCCIQQHFHFNFPFYLNKSTHWLEWPWKPIRQGASLWAKMERKSIEMAAAEGTVTHISWSILVASVYLLWKGNDNAYLAVSFWRLSPKSFIHSLTHLSLPSFSSYQTSTGASTEDIIVIRRDTFLSLWGCHAIVAKRQ